MKKICIVIQTNTKDTGVASYIKSLLVFFQSNSNYKLTILGSDVGWKNYENKIKIIKENKYLELLRKVFVLVPFKFFGNFFVKLFDPFFKFLSKNKFDLVLYPTASSLTYFSNQKSAVCVHDLMHIYEKRFKESGGGLTYVYRQKVYRNISKNFTAVIVDSETGKKQFIESYNCAQKKIKVLEFCCPSYIINSRSELDLSKFGEYLFYPAAFWPHKNHKNLILAFNKIKNKHKNLNLVLAGKKSLGYNNILKLINHLHLEDRVFFAGYVKDDYLKSYYLNSKGLIMPTFYGPTNIPPIEAATLNRPVLVSDIYGMKDQMEDYAIYFNPLDFNSISTAIDKLLSNGYSKVNNDKLKLKFSIDRFLYTFNKILNQVLNK